MLKPSQTPPKKKPSKRKPSQCKSQNCPGKYELDYRNNLPLFVCDTCSNEDDTWQKFYTDYLLLHEKKENWLVEKHKVSCIIGYFCYMYKKRYHVDFKFVPSSPNPFSSSECKFSRMLLATFDEDALKVRAYLTWVFTKELTGTKAITSFGYLKTPTIVRKFMLSYEQEKVKTRSSELPKSFIEWCKANNPNIFNSYSLVNYNDLVSINNCLAAYDLANDSDEVLVIAKAEELGIIKNGKIV